MKAEDLIIGRLYRARLMYGGKLTGETRLMMYNGRQASSKWPYAFSGENHAEPCYAYLEDEVEARVEEVSDLEHHLRKGEFPFSRKVFGPMV